MCHGGWVSDVGMIGKNMSRTAKEARATGGHTSSRTCRIADNVQGGLVDGILRSSTHLRNGKSKNSASASFFCASRRRPARRFECSLTCSRMQVTTIALSKIK